MTMLLSGIALWFVAHSFPAVAPSARAALQQKMGEKPYAGVFSLLILAALLLIVFGWKAAIPSAIYAPPLEPGIVSSALVAVGLVLFFASQMNGNIKRILRHPQMAGTILWAVAHLLTNGDSRSIYLFGALAIWASLEIVMINRREGPRQDVPAASARFDLIAVVVGFVAFGAISYFHQGLFGVSPIGN